ncbi:hypothetical protein JCM13267_07500 [Howardella ureilytica]
MCELHGACNIKRETVLTDKQCIIIPEIALNIIKKDKYAERFTILKRSDDNRLKIYLISY